MLSWIDRSELETPPSPADPPRLHTRLQAVALGILPAPLSARLTRMVEPRGAKRDAPREQYAGRAFGFPGAPADRHWTLVVAVWCPRNELGDEPPEPRSAGHGDAEGGASP